MASRVVESSAVLSSVKGVGNETCQSTASPCGMQNLVLSPAVDSLSSKNLLPRQRHQYPQRRLTQARSISSPTPTSLCRHLTEKKYAPLVKHVDVTAKMQLKAYVLLYQGSRIRTRARMILTLRLFCGVMPGGVTSSVGMPAPNFKL